MTSLCNLLRRLWAALVLVCALTTAVAEDAGERYRFELHDGSILHGTVAADAFEFETEYGLLRVPVGELYELRMAEAIAPEELERVEAALRRLSSESYGEREEAAGFLLQQGGRVARVLERAASAADDLETRARLEEILLDLEADAEELDPFQPPRDTDELLTAKFTARGKVVLDVLHVETPYGKLEIRRAHLRRIVFRRPPREVRVVELTAAHRPGDAMLDIGLEVEPGDRLRVAVTGTISSELWGASFTAAGDASYGIFAPGIPMGALVARVGEEPLQLLGAEGELEVRDPGRLQLGYAMKEVGGADAAAGSWQVKLVLVRALPEDE